ncbi:MAG: hypothetical protein ACLRMZ_10500 [Blautia marasmi]
MRQGGDEILIWLAEFTGEETEQFLDEVRKEIAQLYQGQNSVFIYPQEPV